MLRKRPTLYGLILAISLMVNGFQARQLGIASGIFGQGAGTSAGEALPNGTHVPDLKAHDVGGNSQTVKFSDYPGATVIYVVSPTCIWCERNAASIAYLSHHVSSFRFVAISMGGEGISQFVERTGLPFPILQDPSPEAVREFRLGSTPTTIVVSNQGKVITSWRGAYQLGIRDEVSRFFSLS